MIHQKMNEFHHEPKTLKTMNSLHVSKNEIQFVKLHPQVFQSDGQDKNKRQSQVGKSKNTALIKHKIVLKHFEWHKIWKNK